MGDRAARSKEESLPIGGWLATMRIEQRQPRKTIASQALRDCEATPFGKKPVSIGLLQRV
jgi:hypothetical protein